VLQRIEVEVGHREPSVRELFRAASELAVQRPLVVHRDATGSKSLPSLGGKVADDSAV
jgi:hypothetical protein